MPEEITAPFTAEITLGTASHMRKTVYFSWWVASFYKAENVTCSFLHHIKELMRFFSPHLYNHRQKSKGEYHRDMQPFFFREQRWEQEAVQPATAEKATLKYSPQRRKSTSYSR